MKTKRSLQTYLLFYFSISMIVALIIVTIIFYSGTRKIILEYSNNVTKQLTDKIINKTTTYLNDPALQSKVVSQLVSSPNIMSNHEQLWRFMWEQMSVLPQVQSIFVADNQGSYVQVRREPELATRYIDRTGENPIEKWIYRDKDYQVLEEKTDISSFDPRNRPWFKNTKMERKVYWTDVYLFSSAQTPGISATFPVLDKQGNKIAVVAVNSPLHSLSDFLSEQQFSENGMVFITNANHELIAFPDQSLLVTLLPNSGLRRIALIYELPQQWIRDAYDYYRSSNKNHFTTSTHNQNYITNVVPFPKSFSSDWKLFVIIPENDIFDPLNMVLLQSLLAFLGLFLLLVLPIIFLSRQISKPISSLMLQTKKIETLDLDNITEVSSSIKEIDLMNKAIISAQMGLKSFSGYVPVRLIKQLNECREEQGGKEVDICLLVSNIAGLNSLLEKTQAHDMMMHLSSYLQQLSAIIIAEKGLVDSYINDTLIAFWGAPIELDNSPFAVCKAALNCHSKNLQLNDLWTKQRKPLFQSYFGLHTGTTLVGNINLAEHSKYSLIGNTLNVSLNLKVLNKFYGTHIIISEKLYLQIKNDFFCRLLDYITFKGQSSGIFIYELLCEKKDIADKLPKPIAFYEDYERAYSAYSKQNWQQALDILNSILSYDNKDKSVHLMISRCIDQSDSSTL